MPFRLFSLSGDVDANTTPYERKMAGVQSSLNRTAGLFARVSGRFGNSLGGTANGIRAATTGTRGLYAALSLAAGVAATIEIGKKAIVGASDLQETVSKVGVVFGDSAATVISGADDMAKRFGIVKGTFLDAASSLGLVGKAAGLSQADAAGLADKLAKLAVDASSFYNVSLEDALTAMRSGLVGESEPLRRFGVLLNEASVANEALRLGLGRTKQGLTEGAKVQARASLITKGLADATGDLERTQSGFANRARQISGQITNALVSIGEKVLPVFVELASVISANLGRVQEYLTENGAYIADWGHRMAENVALAGLIWKQWPTFVEIAKTVVQEKLAQMAEIVTRLGIAIGRVGENIWDGLTNRLETAVNYMKNLFQGFATYLGTLFSTVGANLTAQLKNAVVDMLAGGLGPVLAALPGGAGLAGLAAGGRVPVPPVSGDASGLTDAALRRGTPALPIPRGFDDLLDALPNLGREIRDLVDKLRQANAGEFFARLFSGLPKAVGAALARPLTNVERLNADNRRRLNGAATITDLGRSSQAHAARVLEARRRQAARDEAHPVGRPGIPKLDESGRSLKAAGELRRKLENSLARSADLEDRRALSGLSGKSLRDAIASRRLKREQERDAAGQGGAGPRAANSGKNLREAEFGVRGGLGALAGRAAEALAGKLGLGAGARKLAGLAAALATGGLAGALGANQDQLGGRRATGRRRRGGFLAPEDPFGGRAFQSERFSPADFGKQIQTNLLSREGKDKQVGLLEKLVQGIGGPSASAGEYSVNGQLKAIAQKGGADGAPRLRS